MKKTYNNKNKNIINIEELHEEQDREIKKYYNNNENFLEKIYNEGFIYINKINKINHLKYIFETNHLSSDFFIIIILLITFGLFGINNYGLQY